MRIFQMDAALKRRLMLAIIFVLLVVIFLPMLFDSKDGDQVDITKGMPTPPPVSAVIDQKIETLNVSHNDTLTPPTVSEATSTAVPVQSPATISTNLNDPVVVPQSEAKGVDAVPAMSDLPVLKTHSAVRKALYPKAKKEVSVQNPVTPSSIRKVDVTSSDVLKNVSIRMEKASVAKQAWIVQLGSFTQIKNADGLVNRLRSNGFKAFTYHYQANGKWLSRVYVGPFVKLDEAKVIREQLITKMHLNGIVASFHPIKL